MIEDKKNTEETRQSEEILRCLLLLIFNMACFIFNFYALCFIGKALIFFDFGDCAASPLLLVISRSLRELGKIYKQK